MEIEQFKNLDRDQKDLALMGYCPFCKQKIKGWKPVFGSFAPEWWASVREAGVDPANGHKLSCGHRSLKI